ncbi:PEP-CTERM sorting domain-containing protein [Oxalobacteraceae sp. CFBP 8755]|nr:PEP-CTERM sorting domain-containing protein [Oxalobacteraceae sp. CFBP 8755]
MIKKIATLAAGLLFSLTASAGYVQYNFSNGPVEGFIVQHDNDGSIAHYNFDFAVHGAPTPFRMRMYPQQSEGANQITKATTHFYGSGPTNFEIYSDFGGDQTTSLKMVFGHSSAGTLWYQATYFSSILFGEPDGYGYKDFSEVHEGAVTISTVSANLIRDLDLNGGYYENVPKIIPTYIGPNNVPIPEPTGVALLAIGAMSLLSIRRKRRQF